MGGDLLWHNTVWASAAEDHDRTGRGKRYDFEPMFAGVRSLVTGADVALCHEEVPFAAPGQAPQNFPVFAAPPEAAAWIGSFGFDGCTTASNHSLDQGFDGLVRTADLLERAGVAHLGTFRSVAERRRPVSSRPAAACGSGWWPGRSGPTASRCRPDASGRCPCGTRPTCWRRRTRPARRVPTSWSCTCTAVTSTATGRTPRRLPWSSD